MKNTPNRLAPRTLLGAVAFLLACAAQAQPSAHYVPGVEGIKAASLPPPGIYLRDYNVAYYSDRMNDANGKEASDSVNRAFIYANVPRLIWITDLKVLGGNIGVDALIPLQYTSLEVDAAGYNRNNFGFGDTFAEVTWSAHYKQFDVAVGFGEWMPTGNSSSDPLNVEPGQGYWTEMFTAGATWYPDSGKKFALSLLNRYEINQEKDNTDLTKGNVWTLEGGLSYAVSPTVDVGVVGYYQRQVTLDENGSTALDSVPGVGPEVSVFYPRISFGWSLRYVYEFMSDDRLQGHTAVLTLTKRF
jgi:hypothetical protein